MRDARWTSLYVLCIGMLMIVLDITVANVALPSIQHDLGFSQSTLAWVINAYLIAFAGLLLLSGRLGDLFGGKRIFIIGLGLFTASSLLCGVAWSAPALVAARFAQGVGGAMASAVILAMIVTAFPQAGERARAIGVFSFTASAGGSVGLLLGGAITQTLGWHWAFLVNVPIGIITIALGLRYIVAPPGIGWREGADVIGAVTITASLMLGVYAVVQVPHGWNHVTVRAYLRHAFAAAFRDFSRATGKREEAARPAEFVPLAQHCGGKRIGDAAECRVFRFLLSRCTSVEENAQLRPV